jgi:hypothetical protein
MAVIHIGDRLLAQPAERLAIKTGLLRERRLDRPRDMRRFELLEIGLAEAPQGIVVIPLLPATCSCMSFGAGGY